MHLSGRLRFAVAAAGEPLRSQPLLCALPWLSAMSWTIGRPSVIALGRSDHPRLRRTEPDTFC